MRKTLASLPKGDARKKLAVEAVKCAMTFEKFDEASGFLENLRRDFPDDPDVLYLGVRVYSDLSLRFSRQLLRTSPSSYHVRQLNAEAMEAQGKWDDAKQEYLTAIEKHPGAPGLHFRLGRLLLSSPRTPTTMEDVKREFEAELKINPSHAGAEFVLGEMALRQEQWEEAASHFSRATQLDPASVDAYIGSGRALLGAGRAADAIPPLETAAKMQPANPAVHFQLATAYQRSGRKADAAREFALHQQTSKAMQEATDKVQKALVGRQ